MTGWLTTSYNVIMTPELAHTIQQQPVDPDLYRIMQDIYANYTVPEIAQAIARVRADLTMADLASKL